MRKRMIAHPTSAFILMTAITQKGEEQTLRYKFVHDRAMPLQRKSNNAAGLDIASVENVTVKAHSQSKIRT
eukprot:927504-Karenia_brevis.AAC.1